MADQTLKIARSFSLPIDVVTEATAIVATRGAGKSSAAAVIVEEAFELGVQSVIFDRTGVFWGLRSSKSGDSPGLGIYVLGGPHGDVELEPHAGALIADLVVDSGHSFVLDLSDFSKGNAIKFAAHFLERLYDRKARSRSTTLVVMDEAHFYAPQTPRGGFKGDAATLMGAMEDMVGLGRSRGLGVILTTQRTQSLNKAVLDLLETLFVMRMLSPRARQAVRDWIQEKHEEDELGVIASLDSLPTGTAWVWSPLRGILEKIPLRRIHTFDSYDTPKPGERQAEPTARKELDLDALGEQMKATVEKTKANDPAELKKRIRELEEQNFKLNALPQIELMEWARKLFPALGIQEPREGSVEAYLTLIEEAVADGREPERVEVPVLQDKEREMLEHVGKALAGLGDQLANVADVVRPHLEAILGRAAVEPPAAAPRPAPAPPPPPARPAPKPTPPAPAGDAPVLNRRAERMVLAVLAQHPEGRTKKQTAILAGYALNGGGFNGALSKLRALGLIDGTDPLRITDAGAAAIEGQYEPLPTGRALLDHWLGTMKRRAEREVLQVIYDAWPNSLPKEEVAARAGYEASGGGFNGALSKLRTLELITGSSDLRASDALCE
jgi:hypothetical protein